MSTSIGKTVGFRSERGPILVALMLTMALVAIDTTILATAVPSIVGDLGGFAEFPWLFSIYLLAQAVSVPVYAKLADTLGRKPIVLVGIALFLLGSVLSGFAWSMPALIAFRAIQGLGAGAVQPMVMTIAADIYTLEERAKVQGYLASVWAVSSVVGPSLGGVFSEFLSWRWIFFVNIPLCLLAAVMLVRGFRERVEPRRHRIDYLGASLLTVSMSLLILGVLEGGQGWAWDSPQSVTVFVAGAAVFVAFLFAERGAREPVLPLWAFGRRLLLASAMIALGVGAILIGLTSYVPTYLEGSLGVSPVVAGLAVAALTVGWPAAASFSGRIFLRIGFRPTMLIGVVVVLLGAVILAAFAGTPQVWLAALSCFVIGFGLGLVATPGLLAAQSSVAWNERGVVTGANMFSRSIGSAVGVAVFGAVANSIVAASGGSPDDPAVVEAAASGVFAGVLIAAVLLVAATLVMPRTVETVPLTRVEPAAG